jgi:hypothetical protein
MFPSDRKNTGPAGRHLVSKRRFTSVTRWLSLYGQPSYGRTSRRSPQSICLTVFDAGGRNWPHGKGRLGPVIQNRPDLGSSQTDLNSGRPATEVETQPHIRLLAT